jgi:ankyrin repeat protein
MFYDEIQAIETCEEEPSQIFNLIDEGHMEIVEKLLDKKKISINITNEHGDDILSYLLMKNYYNLVLSYMKDKEWNVNHQNKDGDTFAHILVTKNYLDVRDITKELHKKKSFIPNIRNKNGETILDKSLNKDNIYTTLGILKDKRFNNIDIVSFKNLYEKYVKSEEYGTYSKINNLEAIISNLKNKPLLPKLTQMIDMLIDDSESIKNLLKQGDIKTLDSIIDKALGEIE